MVQSVAHFQSPATWPPELPRGFGDKKVKLERYAPSGGPVDLDLEQDSSKLEAELLKGVQGPFTPYSRRDLVLTARRSGRPD